MKRALLAHAPPLVPLLCLVGLGALVIIGVSILFLEWRKDVDCDAWVADEGGQRFPVNRSSSCVAVMPDGRMRIKP